MDLMFMECRSVISILLSLVISKPVVSNMIFFFPPIFYFDNTGNNIKWYLIVKPKPKLNCTPVRICVHLKLR